MSEIVAIVEGEAEQTFVRDQLAEFIGARGNTIWPVLPGKSRKQGGVKPWLSARQDILRTLKEGRYCTTMFDYYGMPENWPGRAAAKSVPWNQRASHVEHEILAEIVADMGGGFNPAKFIPYVQLHEFEALTFTGVNHLAAVTAPLSAHSAQYLQNKFQQILDEAGHPEAINDHYDTCPSQRIQSNVKAYRKRAHGPIVTRRIGLERLREACNHFASWLHRLDGIPGPMTLDQHDVFSEPS
ncbi:MAG TPA: DUF4276 family protein [Blastocatellia bacterium]